MQQDISNTSQYAAQSVSSSGLNLGPVMDMGPALLGWGLACLFAVVLSFYLYKLSKREALLQRLRLEREGFLARLAELDEAKDGLAFEKERRRAGEKAVAVMETQLQEREKSLAEMKERFENDFQAIASRMLGNAHETFLERANETFAKHQEKANSDSKLREKAVDDLVKPMKETLTRYEEGLREMRDNTKEAQGKLFNQMSELAKSTVKVKEEAAKLSTALKSGPRVRGRWGEEQLRNVVEMTGLSSYCDFVEQKSFADGEKLKQPDMVIRLPGERVIAVDSKVSLNAYLDAAEAVDDTQRNISMTKHGEEIWSHVRGLASKDYAGVLKKSGSLDFVVMFIPGENFFAAAMEARPQLFQDAFDRNILLATPTTLIAILKSIAYGWRQEKAAENAHHVAELAQDLYDSLRRMGVNLAGLGKSLETSVKKYNQTIGTIEGSVMPKARKFAEYEMPGTEEKLQLMEPMETDVREPRGDRDLFTSIEDVPPTLLEN